MLLDAFDSIVGALRRFGLLNNNFGCIMKSYWTLQREELEKHRENPSEASPVAVCHSMHRDPAFRESRR